VTFGPFFRTDFGRFSGFSGFFDFFALFSGFSGTHDYSPQVWALFSDRFWPFSGFCPFLPLFAPFLALFAFFALFYPFGGILDPQGGKRALQETTSSRWPVWGGIPGGSGFVPGF
jgi:hypothetical protein